MILSSPYDDIAGLYHTYWADWYLPAALPALEELFFSRLPARARVLDVCCGSGHVTKELVRRGYVVTGMDSSAELIGIAKRELPEANFRVEDARALRLEGTYEGALSTFDSLNHILKLDDLRSVFTGVRDALEPGGLFVFDINTEEAYTVDLREWRVNISENEAGLMRGVYDFATKLAETELIWFVRAPETDCWRRRQSVVRERSYEVPEILHALRGVGFQKMDAIAAIEAGVSAELGFGRVFVSVRR